MKGNGHKDLEGSSQPFLTCLKAIHTSVFFSRITNTIVLKQRLPEVGRRIEMNNRKGPDSDHLAPESSFQGQIVLKSGNFSPCGAEL